MPDLAKVYTCAGYIDEDTLAEIAGHAARSWTYPRRVPQPAGELLDVPVSRRVIGLSWISGVQRANSIAVAGAWAQAGGHPRRAALRACSMRQVSWYEDTAREVLRVDDEDRGAGCSQAEPSVIN